MHNIFRSTPFLILLLPTIVSAQTSSESVVKDACAMPSKILGGERNYAVYLPPGYATSARSYPVLYLLHGAGDDQTGWVQFGEVQRITDQAIANGTATPMIIIMPDADTGQRGYFNDISGNWNYEDFFFQELMPWVETRYRIKRQKRYRAVAGLSMGGGGTFMYALHHPELFSSACPLSASTGPRDLEDAKRRYRRPRKDAADSEATPPTDEQIEAYFHGHSVLSLLESMPAKEIGSVRWYIDCGDGDFLYEGNSLAHIAMRKHKIDHEFRIRDGVHSWSYWRASLPSVLEFVTDAFHQK